MAAKTETWSPPGSPSSSPGSQSSADGAPTTSQPATVPDPATAPVISPSQAGAVAVDTVPNAQAASGTQAFSSNEARAAAGDFDAVLASGGRAGVLPGARGAPAPVSAVSKPSAPAPSSPVPSATGAFVDSAPVAQPTFTSADTASPALRTSPGELVGSNLKHFRIEKRIAAGGMGEVYLGYDTSLSRPVAIKTIRSSLVKDSSFLARFVREATAQANVVHPHVVQVYYVGEDRGVWFLAMQLVEGGSLHDVLAKGGTLRWQDAARHMTSLCEGLVVAERLGIVHRDIKPANVLLDKGGRALLSDFGLAASAGTVDDATAAGAARAAGRAAATGGAPAPTPSKGASSSEQPSGSQLQLASVTQVGIVMGTPEYVAPEQLTTGPLDARADMYALAASFFHLMSGKPVMPVTTLAEAIARYSTGAHAPPLRSLAPGVPRAFARVIDRCLSRDPAHRYAGMAQLHEALMRAGPQPEVPASPLLRALVWLLDVAPFLALGYATYLTMPWLGPLLFFVAGVVGIGALHSTPGIWMMRLRLRTIGDGDVSFARGFTRFLVQHGWYVPLAIGWAALHGSSDLDLLLLVGAAWLALSVLGSLGALFGRQQTLHDWLTKTRVLVDTRYR